MPTTKAIKNCKIFSEKEVQEINTDEYSSLEIYAKDMVFDFTEVNGNLLLRGEGCCFPNLVKVKGNLSVDAPGCSLPVLKTVEGNFTLHCPAALDGLEKVKGNIKCIIDFSFPHLMTVGGSINLKNSAVYARGKKLKKGRIVIPVNHQYEIDILPEDGIFNIDIFGNDLVFPHREILGAVTIFGKHISFPNLEFIHGPLVMENREKSVHEFTHHFPVLKKITGNLRFESTKASFPQLQETTGKIHFENGSYVNFPALEKTGTIMINRNSAAAFPMLHEIHGNLQNHGSETCYLDMLEKVTGNFNTDQVIAKNLVEAGTLIMHKYCEFNHLKRINQRLLFNGTVHFRSLEYINYLTSDRQKGSEFPSLKEVNHYLYDENEDYEDLADKIYFKVRDRVYITKDECIISVSSLEYNVPGYCIHSLQKLVSVLKLRHSSFQHFVTREYEREWTNYSSSYFLKILNKIEKLWDKTEPIKPEAFFDSYDREFRLFCFSYVGVGTLIKKLGALKINEAQIPVNYFQYDRNGNESSVKKINHYEVYAVENSRLGLYSRGRDKHSYAVKCWCPSTGNEHWLWIEPQYKNNALTAVASTFRIHENIIPHIRCLKRQGDLLICELKKEVSPEGNIRPLTATEYFSLLEAET